MDINEISKALEQVKKNSKPRQFKQSYDLIINLKNLDMKKPDQQVDFYTQLHFIRGRKIKVCALVGPESKEESKDVDMIILADDFDKYQDKKLAKRLAEKYDYFIAQADMMGNIARVFGRVFGPRNKMPNPKAGCVVPPRTDMKPHVERLQKTLRITAKKDPLIQVRIGNETQDDKGITDNILTVYNQTLHHLPQEKNNIKSVYIKLTMGKPVKVE